MTTRMTEADCPVKLTTKIIGGKWKTLILYYLKTDARRTSELYRLMTGVSKKMLTQQLRELERNDIVVRKVYAQKQPRVEYALSRHGESLKPILTLMAEWGTKHAAKYSAR
jgi:DNA-binding HxlR family transcriptional regulator